MKSDDNLIKSNQFRVFHFSRYEVKESDFSLVPKLSSKDFKIIFPQKQVRNEL